MKRKKTQIHGGTKVTWQWRQHVCRRVTSDFSATLYMHIFVWKIMQRDDLGIADTQVGNSHLTHVTMRFCRYHTYLHIYNITSLTFSAVKTSNLNTQIDFRHTLKWRWWICWVKCYRRGERIYRFELEVKYLWQVQRTIIYGHTAVGNQQCYQVLRLFLDCDTEKLVNVTCKKIVTRQTQLLVFTSECV
jgi:hypothetical protein